MKTIKSIFLLLFLSGTVASAQDQFLGQIMFVPYKSAPTGWHDCDGSLLSISENTPLFALIGTTYGGDGSTNFALPNAQGRVIIDDGKNSTTRTSYLLGQTGGLETVTLTVNQIPVHTHRVWATTSEGNQNSPNNAIPANTKSLDKEYSNLTDTASMTTMKSSMLSTSGGSQAHNNMMPSLALKCIIAIHGIYPSS